MKWYLYLLRSIPTGKHYIGISADVEKRLLEHNTKSGRWTSAFKPWEVVGTEEYPDRSAAARRERFLKSRPGIEAREELIREWRRKNLIAVNRTATWVRSGTSITARPR
ncbi:MAG: GIY-YIG nuclease family protein [Acidobacteriia bacterium]|nr:GIY-YIG nuclease family protein [Terriglobia bacterium]